MARRLRPLTLAQFAEVQTAARHLRLARLLLRHADCPKAEARTARALASADGAVRHAARRVLA